MFMRSRWHAFRKCKCTRLEDASHVATSLLPMTFSAQYANATNLWLTRDLHICMNHAWNRENTCLFSKSLFSNYLIIRGCDCFEVKQFCFVMAVMCFRVWNKFLRVITIVYNYMYGLNLFERWRLPMIFNFFL